MQGRSRHLITAAAVSAVLLLPLVIGVFARSAITANLDRISLPGYSKKWQYNLGWLSSTLDVSLEPKTLFPGSEPIVISSKINHGPVYLLRAGSNQGWTFGLARIQTWVQWHEKPLQYAEMSLSWQKKLVGNLLGVPYQNVVGAKEQASKFTWRGLQGSFLVDPSAGQFGGNFSLQPFAWQEQHVASAGFASSGAKLNLSGTLQANAMVIDALKISAEKLSWSNGQEKLLLEGLSWHLRGESVEPSVTNYHSAWRIKSIKTTREQLGPLQLNLELSEVRGEFIRDVLAKLEEIADSVSKLEFAELSSIMELLPKLDLQGSLQTPQGAIKLNGKARPNIRSMSAKQLYHLLTQITWLNLMNGDVELAAPKLLVEDLLDEVAASGMLNKYLSNKLTVIYQQLLLRRGIIESGNDLAATLSLNDGQALLNQQPLVPLIIGISAYLLVHTDKTPAP